MTDNVSQIGGSSAEPGKLCEMGRSHSPCPFPATEPRPHWGDEEPRLCLFHAASEPLVDEANYCGIAAEALGEKLEEMREHPDTYRVLIPELERLEAEFDRRFKFADKVLSALNAAEYTLWRK